jgi:hypothetical protein
MRYYTLLLFLLVISAKTTANPPPPPQPSPAVPIDGGLGILIGAGLALGSYKVYKLKKQKP